MGKSDVLASVIVPVFNKKNYLGRCVNSILLQSYRNFEVLLIDDGSKDGSGLLCDAFALKDSRVRVLHQENRGVSAARNLGLDEARGEYIFFVDPDDYIGKNLLQDSIHKMVHDGSDIVFWGIQVISRHGTADEYIISDKSRTGSMTLKEQVSAVRGWEAWRKGYKKILWNDVRFPVHLRTCEDVYTAADIMAKVHKISVLKGIYYFWDRNPHGSLMQTRSAYSYYEEFTSWFHHLEYCRGSDAYRRLCLSRAMGAGMKAVLKNHRDGTLPVKNHEEIMETIHQMKYPDCAVGPTSYYYFNFEKTSIVDDINGRDHSAGLYKAAVKLYSSNLVSQALNRQHNRELINIITHGNSENKKNKRIYQILGWAIVHRCIPLIYIYGITLNFKLFGSMQAVLNDRKVSCLLMGVMLCISL